jgi:hypothetical protein
LALPLFAAAVFVALVVGGVFLADLDALEAFFELSPPKSFRK